MVSRILCAAVALSATAPFVSAQVPAIANRPDAVYQDFADKVTSFIAAKGCGNDATNPATGNVLPPLWVSDHVKSEGAAA
ncbi:hypothetical protein BDK51DRAFT_38476 [Blyttiomyces helicus]|uniref:Uncharacterized protein n=1 Tax=Blyttiomyces helicus TaxID=388810 RepID=A0A4P9W1B5_9FUNG|nr:hypothetical protein BDK51DRAFT_38476 [Blyttiomyces helicus]|eukprot:RKO84943.1 hypothetical protein BDK51DRAFT_38476 [Blyttiomyces helicus]